MPVHVYVIILFVAGLGFFSTVNAGEFGPAVVEGDFLYAQMNPQTGRVLAGKSVHYHVKRDHYNGVAAWKVSMKSPELDTDIFIRQTDGATLYVKRTNHITGQSIEILYSSSPDQVSVYRRFSSDEEYTRKIRETDLVDLGALPQLLLGMAVGGALRDLHFKSIDYGSGKVYEMAALHVGFKSLSFQGRLIRCAIYDIKIDSWLSVFSRRIRVLIPLTHGLANFFSYDGPALTGSGSEVSLRLSDRDTKLAANKR